MGQMFSPRFNWTILPMKKFHRQHLFYSHLFYVREFLFHNKPGRLGCASTSAGERPARATVTWGACQPAGGKRVSSASTS